MDATFYSSVVLALRLSDKAAEKLKPEIERHIRGAQADILRLGVATEEVSEENALVLEAVVTYCLGKMGRESKRADYEEAYQYQVDNIRRHKDWRN